MAHEEALSVQPALQLIETLASELDALVTSMTKSNSGSSRGSLLQKTALSGLVYNVALQLRVDPMEASDILQVIDSIQKDFFKKEKAIVIFLYGWLHRCCKI